MNKRCYKVIFSRSLQCLVVVSEWAKSSGKSDNRSGISAPEPQSGVSFVSYKMQRLSVGILLSLGLATLNITTAHAEGIVADGNAPKNQQPVIISTDSGVTQINIQSPTSGGVSMNQYQRFDVDKKGVVLANNRKDIQTNIAGAVEANPYMAKGEADVIVNQVNSNKASQLNGHIEVAGKRADVIVANPSGITVNGSGFLNVNKTILSTGQTQLQNGKVTGHDISQGKITINGAGLDVRDGDYTALLARSVEINAEIQKGEGKLDIIAGVNHVDSDGKVTKQTAGKGATKAQVSIDTGNLGGMYAGSIRLIGTEKGVGVNNSGQIQTLSLTLDADGRLTNSGDVTADELALDVKGIDNSGKIHQLGSQKLSIKATGLKNSGKFGSSEEKKDAEPAAEKAQPPASNAPGHILVAGELINSGEINAVGKIDVELLTSLANSGTFKTNSTKLHTGTLNNSGEMVINSADLKGSELVNKQGSINIDTVKGFDFNYSISNQSGKINLADSINVKTSIFSNTGDGAIIAAENLSLSAGKVENTGLLSANDLSVKSDTLNNAGLISGQQLTINSEQLINRASGRLSGNLLNLSANSARNAGNIASSGGSIHFTTLQNTGKISGKTSLAVTSSVNNSGAIATNSISTLSGTFINSGRVAVSSANVSGSSFANSGSFSAGKIGRFSYTQNVQNSGIISAQNDFKIRSDWFDNSGSINAGSNINFVSNHWSNSGTISAKDTIAVNSDELVNSGIIDGNDINFVNYRWSNSGIISAKDTIAVNSDELLNSGIVDGSTINFVSYQWDNSGIISAKNAIAVNSDELLNSGTVGSNNINFVSNRWDNSGTIAAAHTITADSNELINSGILSAVDNLTVNTVDLSNTNKGRIAGRTLSIKTTDLLNYGLLSQTGLGLLAVTTDDLLNNKGALLGQLIGQPDNAAKNTKDNNAVKQSPADKDSGGSITVDAMPVQFMLRP